MLTGDHGKPLMNRLWACRALTNMAQVPQLGEALKEAGTVAALKVSKT